MYPDLWRAGEGSNPDHPCPRFPHMRPFYADLAAKAGRCGLRWHGCSVTVSQAGNTGQAFQAHLDLPPSQPVFPFSTSAHPFRHAIFPDPGKWGDLSRGIFHHPYFHIVS